MTAECARPDLAALTGVRSGKPSYYRAYVRSDERTRRAVRAMDAISRALVRTVEGPRGLLEEVVRAAAQHLDAEWTMLALSDGHLRGARPRFVALGPDGAPTGEVDRLPGPVRRELLAIQGGHVVHRIDDGRWVRVPMTLEGRQVGSLVGLHGLEVDPEPGDLSVLRILANQAAVSLHTSEQYQSGAALHRRAQRLYAEATSRARDLDAQSRELRLLEQRLVLARQRELISSERTRIARELHDSVAQYVLSAGMAVELARGEAEDLGPGSEEVVRQLETAKRLTQDAVEQLRRAIYALHRPQQESVVALTELLREVAGRYRDRLDTQIRVSGTVVRLPADADHEIARAVGEALYNVASHAQASRAVVRICYRPDELLTTVSDNGIGEPAELTRRLRLGRDSSFDGRHRGLANIEARLSELSGTLTFRRSRLGGVRLEMRVPLPLPASDRPALICELVGAPIEAEEVT